MKFLFVSDLHIDDNTHEEMIKWLGDVVAKNDVDFVISGGDNGDINLEDLESFGVKFYSIYGNHDSAEWVKKYSNYWLNDGLHILDDFKVLAWNGIFGFSKSNPKWYHRSLDEFVRFSFQWANVSPDIFVSHEIPYYNRFGKEVQKYLCVMNFGVELIKPRVWLNGHIHRGVIIDNSSFGNNMVYVNVESQYRAKYAVVVEKDGDEMKIHIAR